MPVFFIQSRQIQDNKVILSGEIVKHLRDSLRLLIGEEIFLVDEHPRKYRTRLIAREPQQLMMEILEVLPPPSPSSLKIHLGQGLPKGDKMDSIVRKCTELGVDRITPLITQRCVVQWKSERRGRIGRWRRIAFEAAQQSGRWSAPEIEDPESYPEFLNRPIHWDLGLILWEGDTERRLRPLMEENRKGREKGSPTFHCLLIVGPEGGLDPGEVALAERKGLTPVTLGERTLRTETAGPTALAILQYALGDMG